MRKSLASRSPVLLIILAVIATAAILLPHDIQTISSQTNNCASNSLCLPVSDIRIKRIGFPYIWRTNKSIEDGKVPSGQIDNNQKLIIDISLWLALILIIGLFPVKADTL